MPGTFHLAVGGALVRRGRILLVQRAANRTWLPGYWELPGGRVEAGEQLERALVREFREEAGLRVRVRRPYAAYVFRKPYEGRPLAEIDYVVSGRGPVRINDESAAFLWASRDDLPRLKMAPEMRASIIAALIGHADNA